MASTDVIKQGQNVILKKGKSLRLYQVWRKRRVHLDKKHFFLDEAIGKPYGTTWDVHGQNVCLVTPDEERDEDVREGGTDNRGINDDTRSQKLSDEDIKALKSKGQHGAAIVEQLVENSTSFKEKTVYSQAKYLKKKRDKHLMRFQILRPNTILLCEMYLMRAPSKNIHLRIDTLAQILTAANIQSGINVMMMETCQGLLLGAIMERMAGKGTVVQIHSESAPVRLAVEAYNFPSSYKDTLHAFPLDQLGFLEPKESVESNNPEQSTSEVSDRLQACKTEEPQATNGKSVESKDCPQCSESDAKERSVGHRTQKEEERSNGEEENDSNVEDCDAAADDAGMVAMEADCQSGEGGTQGQKRKFQVNPEKEARKQRRRESLCRVRDLLHNTKMDVLVMACRFQPLPIFTALFKFLAPSRPFVVYCHYIEPLMECNEWLRNCNNAVNIRVTETWLREYQVLPERTHPNVNMSGTGGYLLTGTTVSNET
ncbi:tRNA (adenine(58)-N(1))-methyltransferase non-catalytic subunit TRM6-like [Patiria miniata]|uniref:tRNA (adenine(58)-N(1))-methyltransferase non-catalytic subunit TRM6 n=1 Tax=Patiria miniata TaxID=46514 RepID=A0A914BTK1_PATMI|nr:tRNA (adenine(58)-N(1))-methyltransferase non-catalytic subunit TRM6-like [Patiria miniata]